MDDRHREPRAGSREVVERHEVVERSSGPGPAREPGASTNWLLIVVLLVVVLALVWFIFSRGEPQRPLENVEVNVPTVEVPTVREERRIEIQTPAPATQQPAEGTGGQ
jgi:cytoskeletal protein RodZ